MRMDLEIDAMKKDFQHVKMIVFSWDKRMKEMENQINLLRAQLHTLDDYIYRDDEED